MNYMETLAWLLHFVAPKPRKSDQCSHVLLDITIFTFDLKFGPHRALLVHNALLLETVLLRKTYGLTTASLSLTTLHPSLSRLMSCKSLTLWQSFCINYFFQYQYLFKNAFKMNSVRLLTNDGRFCDKFRNTVKITEYSKETSCLMAPWFINKRKYFYKAYTNSHCRTH